jgi:hypothetical protein
LVEGHPYLAVTRADPPVESSEVELIWGDRHVPPQLIELWSTVASRVYLLYSEGSDGLVIYDPATSLAETRALENDYWIEDDRYHDDDVIAGDFQGDDRRLIFSPGDGWLIYSAIETRDRWLRLGDSLDQFLIAFRDADGTEGDWARPFFRD